jgi:branched-chain amino acid transport system substrate-binding protein
VLVETRSAREAPVQGNSRALWLAVVAMTAVASAWARADVPIGAVGPLTGQNIWRGEQIQQGAQMAVADINAGGGVLGQRIVLQVADDACDPDQAVAVAEKLAAEGIVFVAGHTCSHSSIPASEVYEKAGILMISPASTNPRLTDEGGANVFRVAGRDDRQGIVAGDYLADAWADKKIAILHDNSTYGKGLADETLKQLNRRGVKEAMYEAFVPGEKDYSPLVSKMQAAGIDVFYVGGYSSEAGLIVRQARNQGFVAQLVSGDALTTEEFWMITGPAGEGALATFAPDPRRNAQAIPIVERFRAQGFEPAGYTLHTYAAVQVWAHAVEKAGSLALDAVIASLRRHEFDTVLGKIGFDEKGDITAPSFVWYVWQNGEYVQKE